MVLRDASASKKNGEGKGGKLENENIKRRTYIWSAEEQINPEGLFESCYPLNTTVWYASSIKVVQDLPNNDLRYCNMAWRGLTKQYQLQDHTDVDCVVLVANLFDLRSWSIYGDFDYSTWRPPIGCTLPPESAQPQKLCTANFFSGTLKTLINWPLRLKNKIFWRDPAENKHFSSLPRAKTPVSSG